jgi:predicted SprT family Zn-dependent metalloprotease
VTTDPPLRLAIDAGIARGVRVRGLSQTCESIQDQFDVALSMSGEGEAEAMSSLGATIHVALESFGVACERADVSPHDLPVPAQRAFAWLGLLADPGQRRAHLQALRTAAEVDGRVRTRFYNTTTLYRLSPRTGSVWLTAHEAFVGAPEHVLRALVRLGVPYSRKRLHRAQVTTYTETAEFRSALEVLDRFNRPAEDAGRGRHKDLAPIFARVNHAYFEGRMARPHLAWSRRILRQEFGRYEASRDTVMLNRALDAPDVPELALEYVVYHELLHKALGVRVQAGRRQVHNRAFRDAERRFVQRAEAEVALKRLGEKLRRS